MRELRVPWIIAAVFAVLAVVTMFAMAPAVQAGVADETTAVATFTPVDAMAVAGDAGQTPYASAAEVGSAAQEGLPLLGADGVRHVDVADAAS